MSEIATIIGWIVIIVFAIFVVNYFVSAIKQQEQIKAGELRCIRDSAYRIAARRIYFSTEDAAIREQVKAYANSSLYGWAMLDLDLSDERFLSSNAKLGSYEASALIIKQGYPLEFEEGKIKQCW